MTDGRLAYAEELTRVSRQIIGTVFISWQRILRVGLLTAVLALMTTEVVACVMTSSFPPAPSVHLVAVALAFALGYGAAVTMLFAMLLNGGIKFIRRLEGDVSVGEHAASVLARREVGALATRMRRVSGNARVGTPAAGKAKNKPAAQPRPAVSAPGVATAAVTAVGLDVARVAIPRVKAAPRSSPVLPRGGQPDVRRDPDDAIITAPAPAFQSLPVLASRLPRIGWTYDEQQANGAQLLAPLSPASFAAQAPFQPSPPWAAPMAEATRHRNSIAPEVVAMLDAASDPQPEPVVAAPVTLQSSTRMEILETTNAPEVPLTHEAPRGTPDVPGLIPRGWHYNGSVTRPIPVVTRPLPAITRPLPASGDSRIPGGVRSGGLWERVSQALVGQTDPANHQSAEPEDHPLPVGDVAPEDAWLIQ